jgi:hypothetical protein
MPYITKKIFDELVAQKQPDRQEEGEDLIGRYRRLWARRHDAGCPLLPGHVVDDFDELKDNVIAIIDRRIEEAIGKRNGNKFFSGIWHHNDGMLEALVDLRYQLVGEKKNET